jgi:hypothetical protein
MTVLHLELFFIYPTLELIPSSIYIYIYIYFLVTVFIMQRSHTKSEGAGVVLHVILAYMSASSKRLNVHNPSTHDLRIYECFSHEAT